MKIDVLFCAWNRLAFTSATWAWMIAHTDWAEVNRLVVYDDGSEDGTLEFLREQVENLEYANSTGVQHELRVSDLRSPGGVMNHYVATAESDWFAKIDNDIALPGGWLNALIHVAVSRRRPDLIGMEAGMVELPGRDGKKWDGKYQFEPASHIGGVGLMRTSFFKHHPPIATRAGSRHGFTDWQNRHDPVRGWVRPDILCPQLDRIPEEPWLSLSEQYVEYGWQREWPKYSERWMEPYWDWTRPSGG